MAGLDIQHNKNEVRRNKRCASFFSFEMGEFDCFLLRQLLLTGRKIFATIYFIVPTVLYNYWFIQSQKAHLLDAL